MMATGKKMAEFVGEENGHQGQGKGQAGDERGRTRVQELEGRDELIPGDGLVMGIGDGEMRARDEASAEREEKEHAGEEQSLAGRMIGNGGVGGRAGRNEAPIQVDRERGGCAFWERVAHEGGRRSTKMDTLKYSTIARCRASSWGWRLERLRCGAV